MAITLTQLKKIAHQAYLDSKDVEALLDEANLILNQIDTLHKVDVSDVTPMIRPVESMHPLRQDIVTHQDTSQALEAIAPAFENHHYIVPKHVR